MYHLVHLVEAVSEQCGRARLQTSHRGSKTTLNRRAVDTLRSRLSAAS